MKAPTSMPGNAIAAVGDKEIREAFMAVRSEFYLHCNTITSQIAELADRIQSIGEKINIHISTCLGEQRGDQAWRESSQRLLMDFKTVMEKHAESDEAYQEHLSAILDALKGEVSRVRSRGQNWIIGVLVSLVGGSWSLVIILLLRVVSPGH